MTEDTDNLVLRMKTPGNAVCPPQVYPIFQYITRNETGVSVNICPYGTGGDRFPGRPALAALPLCREG